MTAGACWESSSRRSVASESATWPRKPGRDGDSQGAAASRFLIVHP